MELRRFEDKKEFIVYLNEEIGIKSADKELSDLTKMNKELIENVLISNLLNRKTPKNKIILNRQIASSLETVLTKESTSLIITILSNASYLKLINEIKIEGLISEKTANFLHILFTKYGIAFQESIVLASNPNLWIGVSTNALITDNVLLSSKITRIDGDYFEFDTILNDGITISSHFIRRTYETIRTIDRELILELDTKELDKIQEFLNKLTELRKSVESEISDMYDKSTKKEE